MNGRARRIVEKMRLDEKLKLLAGKDFWHMEAVTGISPDPAMLTDGPHGLRKQAVSSDHVGLNDSVPATCFPPACLMASSWNEELIEEVGHAIGEECIQENVAVILGPGTNIKRSPLCGRNFEYYSEDPLLAGKAAASFIRGVEKTGIGTSLKHFAANNQEKFRMAGNSIADERTLREIYLRPFEIAVKEGHPSTVMCSYNMINGVYSAENKWLLTDVLRNEWGFDGFVMTDWGAMTDRVKAILAGLDLEMPGPAPASEEKLRSALENGDLSVEDIDRCVIRLVSFLLDHCGMETPPYNQEGHHDLARKAAADSFVLLENSGVLPLNKTKRYALIGSFSEYPRYQGSGSSKINPNRLDTLLEALSEADIQLEYAPGYDHATGDTDDDMIAEALSVSEGKDAAIVVAGLPDSYESEGFDRTHMDLPAGNIRLIESLLAKGVHVIVIVMAGAPVIMPFRNRVDALLFSYLGGEAAGSALADVLTGAVSPSGHLAETFPLSLEDTPCYGFFSTEDRNVEYREGIMAGYRYYDWTGKDVAYPFGFGLSYTTFELGNLQLEADAENHAAVVSVDIANTGSCDGSEVVQVYVGMKDSRIMRPLCSLAGFAKVFVERNRKRTVRIRLDERCFSYYDTSSSSWKVEDGEYTIYVGTSSRDLPLSVNLSLRGTRNPAAAAASLGTFPPFSSLFRGPVPRRQEDGTVADDTPVSEILKTKGGKEILGPVISAIQAGYEGKNDDLSVMQAAMLMDMPVRCLTAFSNPPVRSGDLISRINEINGNI